MNFHYDPVLGLQYSFDEMIMVDIATISENFDINEWMSYWRKMRIPIYNSVPETELIHTKKITSNIYFL